MILRLPPRYNILVKKKITKSLNTPIGDSKPNAEPLVGSRQQQDPSNKNNSSHTNSRLIRKDDHREGDDVGGADKAIVVILSTYLFVLGRCRWMVEDLS